MFTHSKDKVVRKDNKMSTPPVMCGGDIKKLSNATSD
jgi:hypothetical protein